MIPVLTCAYKDPEALSRLQASVKNGTVPALVYVHDNSETNIGYTAGCNRLIEDVVTYEPFPFIVLANQDIEFRPKSLEHARDFMLGRPRCAVLGFKQVLRSDTDFIWHGGTGNAYQGEHVQGRVSRGECNESKRFAWVNGAAMMVRTEAIMKVGPMDERFFLIGSDSDWCYRFRFSGWEIWYEPSAIAVHDVGVSADDDKRTPEIRQRIAEDHAAWADKWTKIIARSIALTRAKSIS